MLDSYLVWIHAQQKQRQKRIEKVKIIKTCENQIDDYQTAWGPTWISQVLPKKKSQTLSKTLELPLDKVDVRVFWVGASQIINQYGTPKWMVKITENPIKMDDLGGPPLFLETPIWLHAQW